MTDVTPDEPVERPDPPGALDPEEYEPDEETAAVSPDTGTVYEGEGEPARTPRDATVEDEP